MVMWYFKLTLTSPKWMIEVKHLRTKEWPSGRAHLIAEELEETFRPKDMFSKAEQKKKLGQLKYKKSALADGGRSFQKGGRKALHLFKQVKSHVHNQILILYANFGE